MGKSNTQNVIVLMEKLAGLKSTFENRYGEGQEIEAHPRYKEMLEDINSRLGVLASYQYGIERRKKSIAEISGAAIPEETRETLSAVVRDAMHECETNADDESRETQRYQQTLATIERENNPGKEIEKLNDEIAQFVALSDQLVADIEDDLLSVEKELDTWNDLHQIQQKLNQIRSSVNQRLMAGINEAGNQSSDNIFQSTMSELLQRLLNEAAPTQSLVEAAQEQASKINDSPLLPMLASLVNASVKDLPSLNDHLEAIKALRWLQEKARGNADVEGTVKKVSDSQTPSLLDVSYDDSDIKAVKDSYEQYGRLVNAFLADFLTQCHLLDEPQSTIDEQLINKNLQALVKTSLSELKKEINQFPSHELISKALRHIIRKLSSSISKLSEQPVNRDDTKNLQQKSIAELQIIAESLFKEEVTKKQEKSAKIKSLQQEVASLQLGAEFKSKLTFLIENNSLPSQFDARLQASIKALQDQAAKISLKSEWDELRLVDAALIKIQAGIDKIDDDCKRVQQRLKVNELIAQNKVDWQRLLDDGDSEVHSCLTVNGVEVAKSKLTPLTENASMQEINAAAEQQAGLAAKLQERSEKQSTNQRALEQQRAEQLIKFRNQGVDIFKGKDAEVWDKYCQWFQKNKGTVDIVKRLCYVMQVLNTLQVKNSEGNYGVASTALVAAMDRAAAGECARVSPHTRKIELDEQIKQLYSEEIAKSLPNVGVGGSSGINESNAEKEKMLKEERVRFLRNIVNDVLALDIVDDADAVLPQFEQKERQRQDELLVEIRKVTEQVERHYDSDAAGKQEIQFIVKSYEEVSQQISNCKTTDAESWVDKIITLRANYRQAVPVTEAIGKVADKRLSVNWVKAKILTLVDFCRYCVRKLTDRIDAKSYEKCARLTIYGDVMRKSAEVRDTVEKNTADIKISSPAA